MKRVTAFLNRWRVRAGLPSVLLTLVVAKPNYFSLLSGLGFYILGMLLRSWASGHLTKDVELTTSGPYRYTRNPLYLGNILMGLGVVAAGRSWWVLAVIALYFLIFYPAIILKEREKMQQLYPDPYQQYSSQVPALLPTWKAYPHAPPQVFRWELYKKNKEYRAIHASLVFWGLMLLKIVLF
jgi:protein-S-isoprenylcysteine O-methyltransferase Ste14